MVGKYERARFVDLKLEEKGDAYFLNATYEYENEYGIYELNIPHLILPIRRHDLPIHNVRIGYCENEDMFNLGFGELLALKDFKTGGTYQVKEIKKKTRKMTLTEIEKQLGYKIELVSE